MRTIFNILGPITNPAGAKRQILGVFAGKLTEVLATVLGNLGAEDAMVVHGEDGLDEITITDGTRVARYVQGKVENLVFSPEDFGLNRGRLEDLVGGDSHENAGITLRVLRGEQGAKRDIVLINAAAALMVAGRSPDLKTAVALTAEAIDSGRALKKLEEIKKVSNSL